MIYKNAFIVNINEVFHGYLETNEENYITKIGRGETSKDGFDCKGSFIIPGFVETHCHGGYGFDFSNISNNFNEKEYYSYLSSLKDEGVVAFVGTSVTVPTKTIIEINEKIEEIKKISHNELPKLVAWHFEGPFLSKEKKGAHDEKEIIPMNNEFFDDMKTKKHMPLIFTVAPEPGNNLEIIEKYHNDFIFSLGHSNADYDVTKKALLSGIKRITHLYNAMSGFHHHDLGVLNALFNKEYKEDLCIELISDGVHVPDEVILYTYNNFPIDQISLITDSLSPKGLPEGKYKLGTLDIDKRKDWFYLEGSKTLAGSGLTFIKIAKHFAMLTKCSIQDFVKVTSYNSAKSINILNQGYGSLQENTKANFIIIDKEWNIDKVIINSQGE